MVYSLLNRELFISSKLFLWHYLICHNDTKYDLSITKHGKKYISSCYRLIDVGYITGAFKIIYKSRKVSGLVCTNTCVRSIDFHPLYDFNVWFFAIVLTVCGFLSHFITYFQHCLSYFENEWKMDIDLCVLWDFSHLIFI